MKEKLILLNREGFIPGPEEKVEDFFKRVKLTKELYKEREDFFKKISKNPPFNMKEYVKKPDLNWAKSSLLNLFDISINNFSFYFSNENLFFFQGAATWILDIENISLPILQVRKNFKRGAYLGIYDLSDILTHESCHIARAAFDEPVFEEVFAYMSSTNIIRKIFGPIIKSSKEVMFFFLFLFFSFISQFFSILEKLGYFFSIISFLMLSFALFRLFHKKWIFRKCFKKLFSILKDKKKSLAVMFRLKDSEIKKFSKLKKEEIENFVKKEKKKTLRWKMIYLYFEKFL